MRRQLRLIHLLLGAAVCMTFAVPASTQAATDLADFASAEPTPSFDTPELALDRLKSVLASNDVGELAKLLGLKADKLKSSNEAMVSYALIREGAARQAVLLDFDGLKVVAIGDRLWPLPFPLTQGKDQKWSFNTRSGLEEIVNRRIGENELSTIQTMYDYVDAQHHYAAEDPDGSGLYEYAQKLISSPGRRDGLYWPSGPDGDISPAGALVENAAFGKAKRGEGYFGYHYRILTGQGDNVLGGKQSYVVNGHMTGGFALIAWPVKYRETGVQTFIVNGVGPIYQRDLGPDTEARAAAIREFNPDAKWTIVHD